MKRNKIKETKRYRHMSRVGGRVWGRVGEAFVKIQKKNFFWGGGDVKGEVKLLRELKQTKKKCWGVGGGDGKNVGGWLGRVMVVGSGQGGYERSIDRFFIFLWGGGGGGESDQMLGWG